MVFLVIAVTVILAGLTGGTVAGWLGVKRPSDFGWVIFGINEIGLKLAEIIRTSGQEVICIDQNPIACRIAEEKNHRVIYANALEDRTLLRAEIDTRLGVVCLDSSTVKVFPCFFFRISDTFAYLSRSKDVSLSFGFSSQYSLF
jgi:hypothetical protein